MLDPELAHSIFMSVFTPKTEKDYDNPRTQAYRDLQAAGQAMALVGINRTHEMTPVEASISRLLAKQYSSVMKLATLADV